MALPNFSGYSTGLVNGATFMLTLSDKSLRHRDVWTLIDAAVAEAQATVPGIRRFQIKEMGSDVMASSAAPISLAESFWPCGSTTRLSPRSALWP